MGIASRREVEYVMGDGGRLELGMRLTKTSGSKQWQGTVGEVQEIPGASML